MQLHYVTLLALPAAGIIWLIQAVELFRQDQTKARKKMRFVKSTVVALLIFLLSLVPLFLFDLKHDWLNSKAFLDLLVSKENLGGELSGITKVVGILKETHGRSMHILFDVFIGQDRVRNTVLVILTTLGLGGLISSSTGSRKKGYIVLTVYVSLAILGTAFYQHTLFDHYIAYLFAFVCLIYGSVLAFMLRQKVGFMVTLFFAGFFLLFNIPRYPIRDAGWTIDDMKRTTQVLTDQLHPNDVYNIILLSESRDLYGQNYRYFLTTNPIPPVAPENFVQADKLFIINENQPGVDVGQLPIYEIQTFPNKAIRAVYTVDGGPDILEMER
jgi:hypothetical protein